MLSFCKKNKILKDDDRILNGFFEKDTDRTKAYRQTTPNMLDTPILKILI